MMNGVLFLIIINKKMELKESQKYLINPGVLCVNLSEPCG